MNDIQLFNYTGSAVRVVMFGENASVAESYTGKSLLALSGVILIAPNKCLLLTPTLIGKHFGFADLMGGIKSVFVAIPSQYRLNDEEADTLRARINALVRKAEAGLGIECSLIADIASYFTFFQACSVIPSLVKNFHQKNCAGYPLL